MMAMCMHLPALVLLLAASKASALPVSLNSSRTAPYMSDTDIKSLTAQLWNLDYHAFSDNHLSTNIYGDKLFEYLNEDLLLKGTWPLFMDLLDNYTPYTGVAEPYCPECRQEEDMFLNAALQTPVMRATWEALRDHGYAGDNLNEFKSQLKQYWFKMYSRSGGKLDSSAFEHVFVGEIKKGKVTGFHNWLNFYLEEQDDLLQYTRHINTCQPNSMSVGFDWLGYRKSSSGFLIGSSPEFEMAVFTICFVTRPNEVCAVSFNGRKRKIQTFTMYSGKDLTVGSAFPLC